MGMLAAARPTARRWAAAGAVTATLTIVGALLPGSADAVPVSVTDWSTLSSAVASGRNVVLDADITHTGDTLAVPTGEPEIIDLDGHSLSLTGPVGDPAVRVPSGVNLIVKDLAGGGALNATGGTGGAGIELAADATLTVRSAVTTQISAQGGTGAAGIGGSLGAPGGAVVVHNGIVTGTGGTGAAGIGGGSGGNAGSLLVDGGQVTGTGGAAGGAGIGGGSSGSGGPVTVTGGFVSGHGTGSGAGVGAGGGGSAGATAVQVGPDGSLEVRGNNQAITLGILTNAGLLRVVGNSPLTIPAGVVAENSGLIRLRGTIDGTGTIHNTGTILPTPIGSDDEVTGDGQGPAGTALLVDQHNYTIQFSLDGHGGVAPSTMHVYAQDIATAKQALPSAPAGTGVTCAAGWFTAETGGTQVLDTTALSTVAAVGPSTLVLHRHCSAVTFTVTFNAQGGSPTPPAQIVTDGAHATEPTAPAKSGNTFAGWFTAATGGMSWTFATDTVTADITLYAHYAAATSTPTTPPPSTSTSPSTSGSSGVDGTGVNATGTTSGSSGIDATSTTLADTGADPFDGVRTALLLLVAGGALLLAGRRRRPGYSRRH